MINKMIIKDQSWKSFFQLLLGQEYIYTNANLALASVQEIDATGFLLKIASLLDHPSKKKIVYIDVQGKLNHSFYQKLIKKYKIDTSLFSSYGPFVTGEKAFEKAIDLVENEEIGLLIFDSFPWAVPERTEKYEAFEKMLSIYYQKLSLVAKNQETMILTLNTLVDPSSLMGKPEHKGGRIVKLIPEVMINLSKNNIWTIQNRYNKNIKISLGLAPDDKGENFSLPNLSQVAITAAAEHELINEQTKTIVNQPITGTLRRRQNLIEAIKGEEFLVFQKAYEIFYGETLEEKAKSLKELSEEEYFDTLNSF